MDIIDYEILACDTRRDLSAMVLKYIKLGWELHGSAYFTSGAWCQHCQPMVKRKAKWTNTTYPI